MPLHLEDIDIISEIEGISSALIVPCNMCASATVAVREEKPFIQLFRNFLKSAPFEQHIRTLQSQLREKGVKTKSVQEQFTSPMVPLHVHFRSKEKVAAICETI